MYFLLSLCLVILIVKILQRYYIFFDEQRFCMDFFALFYNRKCVDFVVSVVLRVVFWLMSLGVYVFMRGLMG